MSKTVNSEEKAAAAMWKAYRELEAEEKLNADGRIREALHAVFAEIFDDIGKAAGGGIVVEDLHVDTFAVSISVTMKPMAAGETEKSEEAEK